MLPNFSIACKCICAKQTKRTQEVEAAPIMRMCKMTWKQWPWKHNIIVFLKKDKCVWTGNESGGACVAILWYLEVTRAGWWPLHNPSDSQLKLLLLHKGANWMQHLYFHANMAGKHPPPPPTPRSWATFPMTHSAQVQVDGWMHGQIM